MFFHLGRTINHRFHLFLRVWNPWWNPKYAFSRHIYHTVKPVLSGHHIKWTPSIKRTVAKSPNLFPLFTLNETFIKRTQTPKKYLKWSFLLLPTCIKRTLVIKFHQPTCQTPEMQKIASNCHPQIFQFHIKKHDLANLFD